MFLKGYFKKSKSLSALALLAVIGLTTLALAGDDPELPKPWPERLLRSLRSVGNQVAIDLSTALFNTMDKLDVSLFHLPGDTKVGLEFRRDILDNFDLLNTYTVIDKARIRVEARPLSSLSTWTEDVETVGLGIPYVGIIFEPQAMIEWTNVRQVGAATYGKETSSKEIKRQAELAAGLVAQSRDLPPVPRPSPIPDPDLSSLNPDIPLAVFDPSMRARFSKLPNLLTFPFRLPLNRSDVSKMKDGEILGYAFDGQIEVGIGAGLKVIPSLDVLHAGIDIRGTLITHGRYEISVLREDARFARVKLTRLKEKGKKAQIRVGIERKNLYDGVFLFKGTGIEKEHFANYNLNFVPFNWETSKIKGSQFDIVYRYDLDSEEGKTAFHKAVLGRFGLSADTSELHEKDTTPKPVEKVLSRDALRTTIGSHMKVDLASLLKLDWNRGRQALEATLELPDGTHHILQGISEKKRERRTFFGATSQKRTRRMTLYLDEELLAKKDPEGIFVITEITEEDSATSAKELNRSINRMETFLRNPDLLPQMAMRTEGKATLFDGRHAWYGRSSFYYGYSLSYEDVVMLLQSDRKSVVLAALKYFDEDEADRLIAAWDEASEAFAKGAQGPELFHALQKVFTNKFSIENLTDVIFDVVGGCPIDTFATAQNIGFGRIQIRGRRITTVEKALSLTDDQLGFEKYARRLKQDADAVVSGVRVKAMPNGLLKLRFTLSQNPENVFFRLLQFNATHRQKTLAEVVINNRNARFKAGENELLLDPNSPDLLTAKLSRELHRSDLYTLAVAFSRSLDRYGPVGAAKFEAGPAYPRSLTSSKEKEEAEVSN